jgi:hypothetical protein
LRPRLDLGAGCALATDRGPSARGSAPGLSLTTPT